MLDNVVMDIPMLDNVYSRMKKLNLKQKCMLPVPKEIAKLEEIQKI